MDEENKVAEAEVKTEEPVKEPEPASTPAPAPTPAAQPAQPAQPAQGNPTSKDAVRLFFIMISLFFAFFPAQLVCQLVMNNASDNLNKTFNAFVAVALTVIAILLTLPSIIIGVRHKKERWFYMMFMWVGIVFAVATVISSLILIYRFLVIF